MPYLAFHRTGVPEATLPNGAPVVRNVTFGEATKSVICSFVRNEAIANAASAIARYVTAMGGSADDWEAVQVTLEEYDILEATVYGPIRAARAAAEAARKAALRDLLIAQTVTLSSLTGTDRVWKVPTTAAGAREFFRALLLALEEVRDSMLEGESA